METAVGPPDGHPADAAHAGPGSPASAGAAAPGGRAAFCFLLFIFFVSGCAALIYEVVWTRRLFLILGATSQAISTILTAFMAGLAIGSLVAGRLIDRGRTRKYLVVYAALELAIGVYGLLTPWLFDLAEGVFLAILRQVHLPLWPSLLVRFVLAMGVLIVPTTLMGATLPVLSKHLIEHAGHLGRRLGLLYALNTFGAAAGVLLTGFLLMQTFGIAGSIRYAAAMNVAVAFFAWGLDRAQKGAKDASPRSAVPGPSSGGAAPADAPTGAGDRSAAHRWILVISGLGGAASFLYEVAWTRVLTLVLGGAVQVFCHMLATFLIGLALGSFVLSRGIDRSRDLFLYFARIEGLVAIAALLALPVFGELAWVYVRFFRSVSDSFFLLNLFDFILCFATMIVPTFLIGVTFPVVSAIYARDLGTLGRRIGEVYFANTLGGILGSFAAGFLCIPFLGMERTCILAAAINGACAVAAARLSASRPAIRLRTAAAVALAILLLLFVYPLAWPGGRPAEPADPAERERHAAERRVAPRWFWDPEVLTSGVHTYAHRYTEAPDGPAGATLRKAIDDYTLRFYEEGLNAVVTVNSARHVPESLSLQVNGKTDASNADDFPTEVLLGALPLLMHPDPRDVLVIGLGSGITAGAVSRHASVKALHVVEIEEAVVRGARFFARDNYGILPGPGGVPPGDPRLALRIEDARHFCAVTPDRYDVVISEPSNPWMSGPSHLFTLEHFRNLRRVLKEDGLAVQWLQTYSMTPELVYSVILTFRKAFPHLLLVGYPRHPSDFFLFGANRPIVFDVRRMQDRFARPEVRRDLERVGFQSVTHLLAGLVLREEDLDRNYTVGPPGRPGIARLLQSVPLNRDDFPFVEFEAPRHLHAIDSSRPVLQALLRYRDLPWPPTAPDTDEVLREIDLFHRLAEANEMHRLDEAALKVAERGLAASPADDRLRTTVATAHFQMWKDAPDAERRPETLEKARGHFAALVERHPRYSVALAALGEIALAEKRFAEAVARYEAAVAAGSGIPSVHNNLGYALAQIGRDAEAAGAYEKALALDPANLPAYKNLVDLHVKTGMYDRAIEALSRWYAVEPHPVNRGTVRERMEETRRMKEATEGGGGEPEK